ncbi:phosphodiesterase [Streptomyces sp.]|uniref:phosphodiesterase n=1 Tax=Streptomyces sp. TaxID=1931 RepID=UPI002D608317|nr:phosphodiesterase [Streptomyces sp.]HZF91560.1 phosphodiesterase [Streptomyces sp.]
MTRQPTRVPQRTARTTARTRAAYALARRVARRRAAPALHPAGVTCTGTLEVPGDGGWRVPWLDRPGTYAVTVRWSRALGLPGRLPDGLGLALRVENADGAGAPLDLLLTSSRAGRLGRHLPLLRHDALTGPYSTLVAYRTGHRARVLAAFPVRGGHGPVGVSLPDLRQALARAPLRFDLRAAAPGEPWRSFATLTLTTAPHPLPESGTVSYDPYLHCLPELRPTAWLSRLREAAYRGSREGRQGRQPE